MPDSPLTIPSSIPDTNMHQAAYDELGDDDSELSALTEDEGDPDETNKNSTRSVQPGGKDGHAASGGGKGSSSSSSAATLTGTRKSKNDAASGAALKSKQNASSGKRKRNSIVPAPMWGWAGPKSLQGPHNSTGHGSTAENANGSGANHPAHSHTHTNHGSSIHSGGTESVIEEEEEEEEEFRGPPAMEEEEEDEDNSSGGVPRTSGGIANGSHHHAHHGHSAAAGVDGEKHGRRGRAHRTALHGSAKATTRHKGGGGLGPAGDADHTNGSEADPLSVSGEETEGGTHKRSAAKARTARSTGTRKKDRARGEDGDDDYVGEGNESEPGVAGRRQHYKKLTTRKAAATSSKKDASKMKEAAGGADEARNGSDNDDDREEEEEEGGNGHSHGISRKPRSSKGQADFRSMGQGQQTDSDDDYVWHWDRLVTRHSSDYPVLKRKGRMTSKEMEVRDREKAKGLWIPASRRRPPTEEEDADMESPRDSSPISDINNDEELNDEEMDATAPSAREIGHITAAAAASSIMAGSGMIFEPPESPHSSDSEASSRSATPPPKQSPNHTVVAMSKSSPLRMASNAAIIAELNRSPVHAHVQSPSAARRQAAEALGDLARDVSPIPRKTGSSPGKNKVSATPVVTSALADDTMDEDPLPSEPKTGENTLHRRGGRDVAEDKDEDQDLELEVDQDVDQDQGPEPELEPEPEQENEIEQDPEVEGEQEQEQEQELDAEQELDIDHDHDEDHDPDGEQDPEVDMLESDLQPAHRAEALDVLASIELKFALLRERVYVEKMESFAWEEELIIEAVHPELVHLQKELTKRKAKRLELAFKKRDYETANAKKRRRVDEGAVWSWWMNARDELQTEMIAETNRKRRKLERERRAFERPLLVRRIPQPPLEVHISHPPSIRKIMESFPFPEETQDDSRKRRHTNSKPLVYPEVTSLSSTDVANDLEFIYQQRRQALNSGLPHNHLQPGTQLAPTLYDVPASLYGGHHILGPGRPGPGVGIIGPGGISTLPPAVGVGAMNHMGGITGVGLGIPNGLPPPGLGGLQHPPLPSVPHHGPPPPPPPHSVPPHSLQQQMPIHPHPSHSQPHTHQHSHHSHPHPSSAPPGPPPSGYNEYPDAGGPVMYGPSGPPPAGRAMAGPPPPPPPQLMSQPSTSYQQPLTSMHSAHGVHPRERDRDRDRERDREREREQQGDMSPFTNAFPGHNGQGVSGGPPMPSGVSGGNARLGGHAPPGYGHRGDAEYEYEQQQRGKDRERERDREREAQRREDIEPSSQGPLPSSAHHGQQQQPVSEAASSGPTHGGGYMLQPSYYGPPRDRDAHSHAHGGPHDTPSRREGRDVIEGREKDVKGTRDGRDLREGGRRSISPVNVGGSTKQPWMAQGVMYSGRAERADPVDIDEERVSTKERDRRDWDRKEREIERDRARVQDSEREYQQETGKRDHHRQQFMSHQHRHGAPPPPPPQSHMHPLVPSQHGHHHPVGSYHHHPGSHHHHVLHHHHGQSQPPSGHGSPQNAPLRSPRARDTDVGRPHSGPGLLSTTDVIHLTSSKPGGPAHWKQDDHVERRERERDREMRTKHGSLGELGHSAMVGPPITGRPPSAPVVSAEECDRPLAIPFVMASSNAMQTMSGGSSSGPSHGTTGSVSKSGWLAPEETDREREREHDRDRKRERDWERERERERERDPSYRFAGPPSSTSAPPGYQSPHDGRRSPVHRYSNSGSSSSLLSRGAPVQQGPLQNLSVSHSPPRPRQMPPAPAYPHSPTRYGPSAASTTGSPNETSVPSVGVSGPGQPPQTIMSTPINLKLQPLLGSSLPTAATGSPKGVGRPFSPPIYDSNLEGAYSPGMMNVVPRTKSPRESHQMDGSQPRSTTPQATVSTPPGPSAITKLGAPVSEREREDVICASSPTPVKAIGMGPLQTQTSNNVANTSSGASKMSVGQILDRQE